jgi:hypothetical protein
MPHAYRRRNKCQFPIPWLDPTGLEPTIVFKYRYLYNSTKLVGLVQHHHHFIDCSLSSPWYGWNIAHLALNNKHSSLTHWYYMWLLCCKMFMLMFSNSNILYKFSSIMYTITTIVVCPFAFFICCLSFFDLQFLITPFAIYKLFFFVLLFFSLVIVYNLTICLSLRRDWRYQRGNQNPYIKEEQKEYKRTNNDLQNIHIKLKIK